VAQDNLYKVGDTDMGPFVRQWLGYLKSGGGESRTFIDLMQANERRGDAHFYGSTFLMANIAPSAAATDATPKELILFAVLALYQEPNADDREWNGLEGYVEDAFVYFQNLGPTGAAEALIQQMVDRSLEPNDPMIEWLRGQKGPASKAEHERKMASIHERTLRAAHALDPTVTFDDMMLRTLARRQQSEG
jgi:hypothetical protein